LSKNLLVFIQKAVENKLNTLETKLLHKNVSYKGNFEKAIEKNEVTLVGAPFHSFNCPTKHLKTEEQISLGVLQHRREFQN